MFICIFIYVYTYMCIYVCIFLYIARCLYIQGPPNLWQHNFILKLTMLNFKL